MGKINFFKKILFNLYTAGGSDLIYEIYHISHLPMVLFGKQIYSTNGKHILGGLKIRLIVI